MDTSVLSGALFLDLVKGSAANLYTNRTAINDLNVFPVPDGDTGDNMYMTVRSGSVASDGNGTIGKVSSDIAHGMLLGARGNSGVILSRIFAGIAGGFENKETANAGDVIKALQNGIKEAYGAVSDPVEGTILTVYREAAEYAAGHLSEKITIREGLELLRGEAARSLERTPELLQILKEANVVDSGGAGLLCIIEGMIGAVNGTVAEIGEDGGKSDGMPDLSLFTEDSVLEYGYCTEFLLRLQRCKTDIENFDQDAFAEHLASIGESLVTFREGSIVKVHVHTKTPSEVLAYGQKFGEFLTLKIENMTLQHHETEKAAKPETPVRKPHKAYAVVAVAVGDGIRETFTSMGADAVIDGGQSMNPSVADFLDAFGKINADTILVFPGNSNIILTAQQAKEMYHGADVRVIPCRSVCETYAALSVLDTSSGDTDAIAEEVTAFLGEVVSANVSKANRDTEMDGVVVRSGDYIGYAGGKILADDADRAKTVLRLAEELRAGDYGLMILICGESTDDSEAQKLYNTLAQTYRRTEIVMQNGGQPVYDYMILLE